MMDEKENEYSDKAIASLDSQAVQQVANVGHNTGRPREHNVDEDKNKNKRCPKAP
jgi:hypothetical protein